MIRKLQTLPLIFALFTFSCNESKSESQSTTVVQEDAQSDSGNKAVIIENSENSNPQIAYKEWELPSLNRQTWTQAKETSYKDTLLLDQVKASVIISFSTLSKDSSNFIIKNIKVDILKPNPKYILSAQISEQSNMGTRHAMNTFATVGLQAVLKEGLRSTLKLEGKSAVVTAKGEVNPL